MTKQVFAGFFKKAIPVVGGVIGGGITYLSFKPCCDKLKESLRDTLLSNPEYHSTKEESVIIDAIEIQEMQIQYSKKIRAILEPNDINQPRKCPFYQHLRGSVCYSNSLTKSMF